MVNQWELLESLICFIFFNTLLALVECWREFFFRVLAFFSALGVDRTRCWSVVGLIFRSKFQHIFFIICSRNINIRARLCWFSAHAISPCCVCCVPFCNMKNAWILGIQFPIYTLNYIFWPAHSLLLPSNFSAIKLLIYTLNAAHDIQQKLINGMQSEKKCHTLQHCWTSVSFQCFRALQPDNESNWMALFSTIVISLSSKWLRERGARSTERT